MTTPTKNEVRSFLIKGEEQKSQLPRKRITFARRKCVLDKIQFHETQRTKMLKSPLSTRYLHNIVQQLCDRTRKGWQLVEMLKFIATNKPMLFGVIIAKLFKYFTPARRNLGVKRLEVALSKQFHGFQGDYQGAVHFRLL